MGPRRPPRERPRRGCGVGGEVADPSEARRVGHHDPERVAVRLDASCCVQRVTGLDERQVLGGLARERDAPDRGAVVQEEAVGGELLDEPADANDLAHVVGERDEIDVRDA